MVLFKPLKTADNYTIHTGKFIMSSSIGKSFISICRWKSTL